MSSEEFTDVMFREYDSDACRPVAQSEMKILTIEQFMAHHNITDDVHELSRIKEHINSLTP